MVLIVLISLSFGVVFWSFPSFLVLFSGYVVSIFCFMVTFGPILAQI